MPRQPKPYSEVLIFSPNEANRGTVARAYERWRKFEGLPFRCDLPECQFNTAPMEWKGKPLPVIVDHINGNKFDNRAQNLRYVCGNCNSQLPTSGGGNAGRVNNLSETGFTICEKDGTQQFNYFPKTGGLCWGGSAPAEFRPGDQRADEDQGQLTSPLKD